jgi:phosphopantothenate synthetase
MIHSTMGTHVLSDADIIDIVKQHFYRYNQGFKQVKITVDLAEHDKPRIGMELALEPLNMTVSDSIEQLYHNLLDTCKEVTQVETEILNKIYNMADNNEIDKETFVALIKKIKGR